MSLPDWRACAHRWHSYFGPCLTCSLCGAGTMTAAAPGESKPITPPRYTCPRCVAPVKVPGPCDDCDNT